MQAYFESVPHDESCDYCTGRRPIVPLPNPVDAIYCISLQEQPYRTAEATAQFHQVGLCPHVTFYRPARGKNAERAIWASHQAVASHALAHDRDCVLILEDDVLFLQPWKKLAPRIEGAMAALPQGWMGFYLGHLPFQAYFVKRNILRIRSTSSHAYIASPGFLTWLGNTEPFSPVVATSRWIGVSIDSAMANLPGMYALFPMAARQRFLGDYRVNARLDLDGKLRSWRDVDRWRYYFTFRGALLLQWLAVLLSPFHRLTLESNRQRTEASATRTARLIRASGLFDDEYYLQRRPDVAMREANPLRHYLTYGVRENAWPCPLFDPHYYARQSPDLGGRNPLEHFIRIGAEWGRNPHPLFDIHFYKAHYAELIPRGRNPLTHFLGVGGFSGCNPHPLFDCEWYLAQYPGLRDSRRSPLVHYIAKGWRQSASPHPEFDGELYLKHNPDVKAAGVNPLVHFVRWGRSEGRMQPRPMSRLKAT